MGAGGSGAAGGERGGAQDVPAAGTPVSLSWRLRQEGACRIAGVGDAMGGGAPPSQSAADCDGDVRADRSRLDMGCDPCRETSARGWDGSESLTWSAWS